MRRSKMVWYELKWYELHSKKAVQPPVTSTESEYMFKIIVLGKPGKTTFIQKYVTGVFAEDIKMTLGADFSVKKVEVDGTPITLRIWDLASEDRFRCALPDYIKDSNGVRIMYDVINEKTLKNLSELIEIVKKNVGDIPIFLAIPELTSKVEEYVDLTENYLFTEITSETGLKGEHAFELLTKKMLEHKQIER
jgi:GTPase SAR1 family protein